MKRTAPTPTAAAPLDDGQQVRIKGTTTGIFGGVLSGTALWHGSGDGVPVEATVVVTPTGLEPPATSHRFEVPGLGTIVTNDEVTRFELVFPGLYEVDSVLKIDPGESSGYRGTLSTTRASMSIDSEGRATSEWLIKGLITEPSGVEEKDASPPPTSPTAREKGGGVSSEWLSV